VVPDCGGGEARRYGGIGHVVCDLGGAAPQAGLGISMEDLAGDADDRLDERFPLGSGNGAGRTEYVGRPGFVSVAASLAAEAGVLIEHIAKPHVRKEDVVARALEQRGDHPGLVHVISAMEACDAYKPWHDKQTHKTYIRPDSGKCLHYYFYFQDAKFGLVYLRVPTWAPFRLQFYCNGHSWLARRLAAQGIGYTMADSAFVRIDDWGRAQQLADSLSPDQLHRILDRYAALCCPVSEVFGSPTTGA
jgi:hypothetical protein